MKRRFYYWISVLLCFSTAFAAKTKVEDNTFTAKVVNNSDFEIIVEAQTPNEQVVAAGASAEHKFPLHASALYDASSICYSIPLTDAVSCIVEEKKAIADRQAEFVIQNPTGGDVRGCYVVVKNESNEAINCVGPNGRTFIGAYEKGLVYEKLDGGGIGGFPTHTLAANSTAVCKLSSLDTLFLSTSSAKKEYISTGISYRKGYVYYISYNAGKVTLVDARPIQCIKEKLWRKSADKTAILRGVKTVGKKAYVLGTESAKDAKDNLYSEGFIECFDSSGKKEWKAPFSIKGADTYLYDIALYDSQTLLVAGQAVAEDYQGFLLFYDLEGKLKKQATVKESIGFDTIRKDKNSKVYVRGASQDGAVLEYLVGDNLALTKVKASDIDALAEEFVQSVTGILYDDDGLTYIAGESARQERPTATVVQVKADGGVNVLYSAKEPNSYIMDMKIKRKEGLLLVCGSLNAKDSAGNGGSPFVRCVNIKSGAVEWECIYKNRMYEVAFKIAEFSDYGFALLLVNANDDGNISSPCALFRTNAVGKYE